MNNSLMIAFFVLDAIVTFAIVFYVFSRRKSNNGSTQNKGSGFSSMQPSSFESPFSSTTASTGTAPTSADIQDLLRRGQKIEAIKLYRERTGVGLKEAKDAVEALERGENFGGAASSAFNSPLNASMPAADVNELLRRGQKIEAIKLYREQTGVGLKEAKDAVDALERQMR